MKNYLRKEIGDRIKNARLKRFKGTISQKQMADLVKVPYRTYQNWELGISSPKTEMIIELANILKTDPGELVFEPKKPRRVNTSSNSNKDRDVF